MSDRTCIRDAYRKRATIKLCIVIVLASSVTVTRSAFDPQSLTEIVVAVVVSERVRSRLIHELSTPCIIAFN